MVRIKLDSLKSEINHYLGIPYFSNKEKLTLGNVFVGKGTWQEIKAVSSDYAVLKKNAIGIDCSGLVYQLLKFIDPRVDDVLIGTDSQKGVRRLSANLLTSPPNSHPVDPHQAQTADLIRTKEGRHVIFIIERTGNLLHCVQSTETISPSGVQFLDLPLTADLQVFRLFLFDELTIL